MKLSERRKQEIYEAVTTVIMDVRIALQKTIDRRHYHLGHMPADTVDALLFYAQNKAGQAAIAAAEKARR